MYEIFKGLTTIGLFLHLGFVPEMRAAGRDSTVQAAAAGFVKR